MKKEQEERINQIIQSRQQERETRRKMICYLKLEEERQKKLRAEEEARQREEAERRKREEAERRAKLDEIAEKQRQTERELEEKERQRREQVLRGTPTLSPIRPKSPSKPGLVTATTAAPSSPGKYVPRHLRERVTGGPQ